MTHTSFVEHPYYRCDMLVNQGVYCGGDPIGHYCDNIAKYEHPDGPLFCEDCYNKFLDQEKRKTISCGCFYGKKYQDSVVKYFGLVINQQLIQIEFSEFLTK